MGFLPAEPPRHPMPSQDIDALVRSLWEPRRQWNPQKPFQGFALYDVFFRLIPTAHPEILSSFGCGFYGLDNSDAKIGGLVDFEFKNQRPQLESYAQNLLDLAQALYPNLLPSYGWVDEDEALGRWIEDVVKIRLKVIGWASFFGPPYVAKYGRDFLLGLPGWKTEELPDGGVFHQLSPTILTDDRRAAQDMRRRVETYCARAGVKVRCRGPYHVPQGRSEKEHGVGYGSDQQFESYLQQILSTTLTLKGGTRVKPIYVEWARLTSQQRALALAYIKAAAIAEIREHRNAPIRFEFNELPDDLEQMMQDLVGDGNPDFVYTQMKTG
jgi:hypothetical protein